MSARRRLDVLVLCHDTLVPPAGARGYSRRAPPEWRTEFDVLQALRALGHRARILGAKHELEPVFAAIRESAPDVVFNLLVEFHGNPTYDQHVASLLELLQLPYTGCNPRGLTLARDKALSKQILAAHGVDVPRHQVFARGSRVRRARELAFPLIVKSRTEEASLGLARASLVTNERELARRVALVHARLATDAIAEEYLDGREPRYGALWLTYFPGLMLEWYPNVLVVSQLIPRSPTLTTNIVEFYYPEDIALFEREFVEAEQAAYVETAMEDGEICTRMDRGRKALHAQGISEAGPYQSPMEDALVHFHEYLRRELKRPAE